MSNETLEDRFPISDMTNEELYNTILDLEDACKPEFIRLSEKCRTELLRRNAKEPRLAGFDIHDSNE